MITISEGTEMKPFVTIVLIILLLCIFNIASPVIGFAASPNLISEYDFNGNLTDSLGNSILNAFGVANDGNDHNNATSGFASDGGSGGDRTYWYWTSTFDRGGGFWIDVDRTDIAEDYSIGVRFAYNSIDDGYYKIIDYKDKVSDDGFYFHDNKLMFYPGTNTEGITDYYGESIIDVIATRNSTTNEFVAYTVVNGSLVEEFIYDDSAKEAVPIIIASMVRLGFFYDDNYTSGEATDGGKVYSIKIWDGPLSPDEAGGAMDPSSTGVVTNPQTGESTRYLWIYILFGLFFTLGFIMFLKKKLYKRH
jgi:hypothetical protein